MVFDFCRASRRYSQCFTNESGAVRKSYSTAHRQNGLRPLSQACPSGGKRAKIDSTALGFGVSAVFLRSASFGGSVGANSSSTALPKIDFFYW